MIKYLLGIVAGLLLVGCQTTYDIEYYEPTEANKAYCIPATANTPGMGPVKHVTGKSGALDFSDHKSFTFRASIF